MPERFIKLGARHRKLCFELGDELFTQVEKISPALKERHVEESFPAELLCQDTKTAFSISCIGRICPLSTNSSCSQARLSIYATVSEVG